MKQTTFIIILSTLLFMSCKPTATQSFVPADRGEEQLAALWTEADGTQADMLAFIEEHKAKTPEERDALFESLQRTLAQFYGHGNALNVELRKPTDLTNAGEPTELDYILAGYNPYAHFTDDMFDNQVALICILNFPAYTLDEKNTLGKDWTRRQWAEARLGEVFSGRIPAAALQGQSTAFTRAETYIADYNIGMRHLLDESGNRLWDEDLWLLSHWNLRDEIKAQYADHEAGQLRQEAIFEVMKHIVRQSIPPCVINSPTFDWCPFSNRLYKDGEEIFVKSLPDTRYQYIIDIFHSMQEVDKYCPTAPTAIQRFFDNDIQISAHEVDSLFRTLLSSPYVHEVAGVIREQLGRDLRPYDIWYDGFKQRASLDQNALSATTRSLYPTPEAFQADMPRMLQRLGFTEDEARFVASHIVVEPARGSGHASPCVGYGEPARLRTRIAATGMDYKGYNIAVHEFGHNVEEVLDLYRVDYFTLSGIPNSALTEASAFYFQARDLQLLPGSQSPSANSHSRSGAAILDDFWSMVEIMSVSLVDMQMWQWLYAHPDATADELREAVLGIAAEVWNEYLAADLGEPDCPLLAIYSHMVEVPMSLPNYPLGHLAQFQIEEYFAQLPNEEARAREYQRIYSQGRLTPHHWMLGAVGSPFSVDPVLRAVDQVVK